MTIHCTSQSERWEEQVYLAFISAPRHGNQNKAEESFAFAAREIVREELIGQKIDFVIQYII